MKHLFQKLNMLRVLAFFFEEPKEEAHLRMIARKLKMSPATVLRALKALISEELVARKRKINGTFFFAKQTCKFRALKTAQTVLRIVDSGAVQLLEDKTIGLGCVLLYGSSAKGEDGHGSDYDFLVIAAKCTANAIELGKKLGRECSLKAYTIVEWKRISSENRAFYLEVISNSIALKGRKPVID